MRIAANHARSITDAFNFSRLPSTLEVIAAQAAIDSHEKQVSDINLQIAAAKEALAALVTKAKAEVGTLKAERTDLVKRIATAKGFIAPVRRIPTDLLSDIFRHNVEDNALAAWALSSVSRSWRSAALLTPVLWSRIHITSRTPVNAVRLWIERSGWVVPLDVKIELALKGFDRPRKHILSRDVAAGPRTPPSVTYVPSLDGIPRLQREVDSFDIQWLHAVMYHIHSQASRWRRFMLQADDTHPCLKALNVFPGDLPLLEEFVVQVESGCQTDFLWAEPWVWGPVSYCRAPLLRTLKIQHLPFAWGSSMLSNLRSLHLTMEEHGWGMALDQVLKMLAANSELEKLTVHLPVLDHVLPPTLLKLENLKELSLSGHRILELVDYLILPSLTSISLEGSEPVEDALIDLLQRSQGPPVRTLKIRGADHFPYSVPSRILSQIPVITHLDLSAVRFFPVAQALCSPEEVLCPRLDTLVLTRLIDFHSSKRALIRLIDIRNPSNTGPALTSASASTAARIKTLEITDGRLNVGEDAVAWMSERIENTSFVLSYVRPSFCSVENADRLLLFCSSTLEHNTGWPEGETVPMY